MTRLPFLVEHGDLIWKLLAVLGAAAAIALVRRYQARRERRATARELTARKQATTAPVEGVATVRGTLRGGRVSSVSLLYLRGRRPYYDERAAELWLDCEGQQVTLVGPVRVVRGTRLVSTRDRWSGLPEGERAVRSSPILHRLTAMTASVGEGDEVFVTARLAARPADVAMGYREAATAWTGTPHGDAIEVVAARPAVHAAPLGSTRTVVLGLAGAVVMTAALWGLGAAAMASAGTTQRTTSALEPAALGGLDALALAAATPWHRDEALEALETRLATRTVRTAQAFALQREAAQLRGGCGAEIRARIAQDDIDGLAQVAQRCKDDRAAANAYQLLGMFQEAAARSKELPSAELPLESMIAVHAWWRAAEWAAAHRGGTLARDGATTGASPAFECAAEWWSRLGEQNIDAWMARARFAMRDAACAVFATLSLPEADQATALTKLEVGDARIQDIASALAWARGAPPGNLPPVRDLHAAMFATGDRRMVARALLSEAAYKHAWRSESAEDWGETAAWRAVIAMLSESIGTAIDRADRAGTVRLPIVPGGCEDDEWLTPCNHGYALGVAFALRFGKPMALVGDYLRDPEVLWLHARSLFWGQLPEVHACDRPELGDAGRVRTAVLHAERDGDAHDFAALLARCTAPDAQLVELAFAVWPQVRRGRAELAEVLRRLDLGPGATDPLAVIGRAALRRDLARLIGDERMADAWAAVVDRHMAAFSQPMPLTVLVSRELLRAAER